jgi:nucleoside-diphosphate-sugar epimerase
MRILFTGGSSFTGYWFIQELVRAGHEVTAVFRRRVEEYADVRARRVAGLLKISRPVFECSFGDDRFLHVIRDEPHWDLICQHAAEAANYKSPDFDVAAALRSNTRNLAAVLDALRAKDCARVLLTGSVFEPGEGAGSDGLPAFSPYGLSKGLTADVFRYYTRMRGMRMGKFVIPNPFGPYEEPRFTTYLARSWLNGETPCVNTPEYVRDNVHVSLLARGYARFAQSLGAQPGYEKINPGQYIEPQAAFAGRFATELARRLGIACPLELRRQSDFLEPRIRINTDTLNPVVLDWTEDSAWDELAEYYRRAFPR